MARRLTRRPTLSCAGCFSDFVAPWGSTVTVEGRRRDVCMTCAAVLKRLGLAVTPNEDKEG